MKKEYFSSTQDVYIGTVYISPANSTYTQKLNYSPFDILESEVRKYCAKGQIVLMGDFNSRTGVLPDYIVNDNVTLIPVPASYVTDNGMSPRCSQDAHCTVSSYGKYLVTIHRTTGLKIANGRILGDPVGKFTCHNYNGILDYIICDYTTLSKMRYFAVDNLIGDL